MKEPVEDEKPPGSGLTLPSSQSWGPSVCGPRAELGESGEMDRRLASWEASADVVSLLVVPPEGWSSGVWGVCLKTQSLREGARVVS